jgi:hypothetical protein
MTCKVIQYKYNTTRISNVVVIRLSRATTWREGRSGVGLSSMCSVERSPAAAPCESVCARLLVSNDFDICGVGSIIMLLKARVALIEL